jgi:hypothetical protein
MEAKICILSMTHQHQTHKKRGGKLKDEDTGRKEDGETEAGESENGAIDTKECTHPAEQRRTPPREVRGEERAVDWWT